MLNHLILLIPLKVGGAGANPSRYWARAEYILDWLPVDLTAMLREMTFNTHINTWSIHYHLQIMCLWTVGRTLEENPWENDLLMSHTNRNHSSDP